jgi:acetyl-CoA carboxylase carboxyl transferase subunit alpha
VPLIAVIVGEGGSGGAWRIAAANRVLMFEHAVYSVISPEGCASILWRTADKAADAAEAMKITAQDLLSLGVADRIVDEPSAALIAIRRARSASLKPRFLRSLRVAPRLAGMSCSSSAAPSISQWPRGTRRSHLSFKSFRVSTHP